MTEKLLLLGRGLITKANGESSLDGILNYRLDVFLRAPLADDLLTRLLGSSSTGEDTPLGPIPFLVTGPLAKPELKPDPNLLAEFQDNLARKKTQKIFRHFLPEDLFFERRKSS